MPAKTEGKTAIIKRQLADVAGAKRSRGCLAGRAQRGDTSRNSSGAGSIRDLFDGSAAEALALSGELDEMMDQGQRTKDKGQGTKDEAGGKASSLALRFLPIVHPPSAFVFFPMSFVLCTVLSACVWHKTWDQLNFLKAPPPPPPPVESFVLHGHKLEEQKLPEKGTPEGDLAGAKELFRQGEYAKAEKLFHRIAEDTHNATQIAEEARYYEAECLRLQGNLPRAADTYTRMLNDFQSAAFREQAVPHSFKNA